MSTLVSSPTRFKRSRLRRHERIRDLVAETRLDPSMLILPIFVDANVSAPTEIVSLPGHARLPVRDVQRIAERARAAGIGCLLHFGLPAENAAIRLITLWAYECSRVITAAPSGCGCSSTG